jgi:DNA-binding SARP family transcriptional activator/TolB-like protein
MALEIAVLGPLVVKGDAGQIEGFSRKARALLGYLAVGRGRAVSREHLAALLWPDQASEQARHSLRNGLFELRRAFGPSALPYLEGDAAECRLKGAIVDLDRFVALSQAGVMKELERAAALYRGEFLAGLAVPAAPFQDWLGAERERIRGLFCDLLQCLAAKEDAAGDYEAAIAIGRRLVAIDPLSEIGYRTLMRAYGRSGRRSEALRQYRICAFALKHDLGIAPEEETRALASEIARSSGRIAVAHAESGREGGVIGLRVPSLSDRQTARPRPADIAHLKLVAAQERPPVRWPRLLPSITVGVTPFDNLTGDRERRRLADGLSDDLVSDLMERGRGLSLARLSEGHGALTLLAPAEGGEVGYTLSGSVQNGPVGTVRINAQIRDAASGEYRWARRFELAVAKAGSLQTNITGEIARELNFILLQEASRRAFIRSGQRPSLGDCLARAAEALDGPITAELAAEAQNWLLGALARDPRNLTALVGLARTCQFIVSAPWWADADVTEAACHVGREAVATALSLAPRHAYASTIAGMLCSATGELDRAAQALAEALDAEPANGVAQAFAGYNAAFLGRAGEAVPAIARAMRLDPSERRHSVWLFFAGFSELLLGRAGDAVALFEKSLARNPRYGGAQLFRGAALALCGRRADAERAAAIFREQYPRYRLPAFAQQWLSRSHSPIYRRQINPAFEAIRSLGAASAGMAPTLSVSTAREPAVREQ